ncbi:MAG: VCBS repeat-containing protein [Fuerstiella sp.]|nr:VCBS repeat-containing protein [Fuerstiella sp.]
MKLIVLLCLLAGTAFAEPWKRHTIDPSDRAAGKRGADGVRLADVNEDGHLDITTGWEEGGAVAVYLNPGPDKAKNAWTSVTVGSVRGVEDAVFADLDADGAVDVVSCAEGKVNNVFVHWAPRSKADYLRPEEWKTEVFPASNGRRWMFALPMDVNTDGRIDLVIGSKNENAIVGWLENPATPRDAAGWKLHELTPASWIMSLRATDLDNDGDEDILYSDRFGSEPGIYCLKNPGGRSGRWVRQLVGGKGHQVMFLSVGDLEGKSARNVTCPTLGGDLLYCARGKSGDWTETVLPLPFGLKAGKAVAIADVNMDGRPDLVTTSEAQREADDMVSVAWKENRPNGWVDHAISDRRGRKFDRIEMLDVDGDGDSDLITCEEVHDLGIIWYENPTR